MKIFGKEIVFSGIWKYAELKADYKSMDDSLMHAVRVNVERAKKIESLGKQLEATKQELAEAKQIKWTWDTERREWLPAEGNMGQIQSKVPFPLMAKEIDE